MSLAWSSVKALSIPVGGVSRDVKRVSVGGTVLWEKPNPVPYDSEVEYIESTGTQYIDTGVLATDTTGVMANVSDIFLDTASTQCFFGVFGSDNRFALGLQALPNNIPFVWWNAAIPLDQTINYANVSAVALNYLNSRTFSFGPEWTGSLTATYNASQTEIRIFNAKRMDNGLNVFTPGAVYRLHGMRISVGANVVRDYIPVRVGSGANAVGCLYDKLGTGGQNPDGSARNDGLYFRQGSGAFVVGPDKGTASLLSSPSPALQLQTPEADPDATADEPQEEPQTD